MLHQSRQVGPRPGANVTGSGGRLNSAAHGNQAERALYSTKEAQGSLKISGVVLPSEK